MQAAASISSLPALATCAHAPTATTSAHSALPFYDSSFDQNRREDKEKDMMRRGEKEGNNTTAENEEEENGSRHARRRDDATRSVTVTTTATTPTPSSAATALSRSGTGVVGTDNASFSACNHFYDAHRCPLLPIDANGACDNEVGGDECQPKAPTAATATSGEGEEGGDGGSLCGDDGQRCRNARANGDDSAASGFDGPAGGVRGQTEEGGGGSGHANNYVCDDDDHHGTAKGEGGRGGADDDADDNAAATTTVARATCDRDDGHGGGEAQHAHLVNVGTGSTGNYVCEDASLSPSSSSTFAEQPSTTPPANAGPSSLFWLEALKTPFVRAATTMGKTAPPRIVINTAGRAARRAAFYNDDVLRILGGVALSTPTPTTTTPPPIPLPPVTPRCDGDRKGFLLATRQHNEFANPTTTTPITTTTMPSLVPSSSVSPARARQSILSAMAKRLHASSPRPVPYSVHIESMMRPFGGGGGGGICAGGMPDEEGWDPKKFLFLVGGGGDDDDDDDDDDTAVGGRVIDEALLASYPWLAEDACPVCLEPFVVAVAADGVVDTAATTTNTKKYRAANGFITKFPHCRHFLHWDCAALYLVKGEVRPEVRWCEAQEEPCCPCCRTKVVQ